MECEIVEVRIRPYEEKLIKVLYKLLKPTFNLVNNDYLNKLYTHLQTLYGKSNKSEKRSLNGIYLEWIKKALNVYETKKPTNAIVSFVLNVLACLSKDESVFVKLNSINTYERLITILSIQTASPSIKLGFIKLMSGFLEHKSGLQWSLATHYWNNVIEYTLQSFTLYIEKEGCKFINKFLSKAAPVNEVFTKYVVSLIISKVDKLPAIALANGTDSVEIRSQMVFESILPTLKLITNILEEQLLILDENIIDLFLVDFQLFDQMKNISLMATTEEFYYEVTKLMVLAQFLYIFRTFSKYETINYSKAFDLVKEEEDGTAAALNRLIEKEYTYSIIKLLYDMLRWWKCLHEKMPNCEVNGKTVEFDKQLEIFQLIPVAITGIELIGLKYANDLMLKDETRDQYITKLLKLLFTRILKTAYHWRDLIVQQKNIISNANVALRYIRKSINLYDREAGVMVFQGLVYSIQDFMEYFKRAPQSAEGFPKCTSLLELNLETTTILIETFDITWKDSVESISVMLLTIEILSIPTWGPKLVTKALKLINVTIIKYMSPNMALLMDNSNDPTMTLIGPLLYAKCHDPFWEVRDSAIETLCTICYNANRKFPTFQTVILESKIPKLMVDMAFGDAEPYVRASALKCIQEMVQVEDFWNDLLLINNLYERICDTLIKESEGIVRKEAATLIYKIYVDQVFPDSFMTHLYDVMTHAANADLHWEVKVSALIFWEAVVNKHLEYQGMIDGTFPNVTFSKENRKIMVLNSNEVQTRLIKVLNQLSEIGCLAVLVAALQDDDDFCVVKEAVRIINNFDKHLKTYNVTSGNANLSQPPSPLYLNILSPATVSILNSLDDIEPNFSNIQSPLVDENVYNSLISSVESHVSNDIDNLDINNTELQEQVKIPTRAADVSDAMLDELLNGSDMKILETLCRTTDDFVDEQMAHMMRRKNILSPGDFINIISQKLKSSLPDKSQWLMEMDDFDSLLDDILKEYNTNINNMDCY